MKKWEKCYKNFCEYMMIEEEDTLTIIEEDSESCLIDWDVSLNPIRDMKFKGVLFKDSLNFFCWACSKKHKKSYPHIYVADFGKLSSKKRIDNIGLREFWVLQPHLKPNYRLRKLKSIVEDIKIQII